MRFFRSSPVFLGKWGWPAASSSHRDRTLRSNPGDVMSRGEHASQQPRQATRPVYLEDAAIVHVMVSTYKAWIEPWENHLQQTGRAVRKAGG